MMASEQIFTWEGISLPSYWGGNWGTTTADVAFDRIKDTGANSVAIIPSFFMPDKTSNTMGLADVPNFKSETFAQTKAAMADVTSRGMQVMLKPHVESMDYTWRAEIAPTDPNLWFQNYKGMILQYAQLAEETGAPMLCIGTELKSMSGAAYRDKWVDLINAVRSVYHGLVTYASTYDEVKTVSFWDKVDYIGIDGYVPLTLVNNPTVDDLVRGWTEPSSNSYVHDLYGGKSVVDFYRGVSEQYGKKIIFTEIGYRSLDGTAKDPGRWADGGTVDEQEQRDAYDALFKVMENHGGQWLDGAFLWSYHPFEDPVAHGVQKTDFTPQNKPANAVLTAGYSSPAHVTGLTRNGTALAEKLDGGYHNDVLNGAGGSDSLWGGAGDDRLTGGSGDDTLEGGSGINVAVFSGTKAQYIMVKNADGSFTVTDTRSGQDGSDHLKSIQIAQFSDQTLDLGTFGTTPPPSGGTPTPPPSNGDASPAVLRGTARNDVLTGQDRAELIFGLAGNDTLRSRGGDDKLWGGLGNDKLSGGAGKDVFVFNTKLNKKTNLDKIADFNVKDDTIWLDNAIFKKLGKGTELKPGKLNKAFFTIGDHAKDKNDYLIYDNKKGVLFYDADGSGKGKAMEIATLSKKLKMTVDDFKII
ncbi:glycoside hydrolase family 113 [Microvirga rosea]|uniref:glycoside hydrolase family 113 n=1 Tax=Microvirga rosea TaxID=2715425 RepID=UPI001D0B41E3|nr:hypothetical protein [Microvirga rosea]MCB8820397.1 hypothetical protein [Microvirga rosea]